MFSGIDDTTLPDNVRGLSESKRRQFVHVYNGAKEAGVVDANALEKAQEVVSKSGGLVVYDEKGYVDSWDVDIRKVSKEEANYQDYGAKAGRGCASCQWFVSPNSCVLVSGDISPTGDSRLYMPRVVWQPKPLEVVVVEKALPITDKGSVGAKKPSSLLNFVISKVKEMFADEDDNVFKGFPVFWTTKDADGNLRFFTVWSNIFEDKADEIFSTKAHKRYVEWVDESKLYPELQIWHMGPGSSLGNVDFVDFVDGFCVASGLILKEKEELALKLAELDLGVSHGFFGVKAKNTNYYDWYVPFEISLLPRGKEANPWTAVAFKELDTVGFAPAKKQLLTTLGVPAEEITAWEKQFTESTDKIKQAGIAWKEEGEEAVAADEAATKEVEANTKAIDALMAGLRSVSGDNIKIATAVAGLAEKVDNLAKEFKKTTDDRVADVYAAGGVGAGAKGHVASQSDTNLADRAAAGTKQHEDWFGSNVIDGILGVTTGGAGADAGLAVGVVK